MLSVGCAGASRMVWLHRTYEDCQLAVFVSRNDRSEIRQRIGHLGNLEHRVSGNLSYFQFIR